MRFSYAFAVVLILSFITVGCNGGGSNPILPGDSDIQPPPLTDNSGSARVGSGETGHLPVMVYQLEYDVAAGVLVPVPQRDVMMHFNVTTLLFPPNCSDCFELYVVDSDPVQGWIELYVSVRNPSPFDAYDARIILDAQVDGYGIINPDGWTELFDLGHFPRNPFFALAKTEPHRIYPGNSTHARQFYFYYPPGGYNPADYYVTIEVSWPNNCDEPYEIVDFQLANTAIPTNGTPIPVSCRVHSWWNDIESVTARIELPGDTTPQYSVDLTWAGGLSDLWYGDISLPLGSIAPGDYKLWIETHNTLNEVNSMWQVKDIEVVNTYTAWAGVANTFGGNFDDAAQGVAKDSVGNVYVTGYFGGTIDFDGPLGPEFPRSTHGDMDFDAYLIKYNVNGVIEWIQTWGGEGSDYANAVAVDPTDTYIYVLGEFGDSVWFDPDDPGNWDHFRNSKGELDVYISCFDSTGDFRQVESFGGDETESGKDIVVDLNGDVIICGTVQGAFIDAQSGVVLSSNGGNDAYVAKWRLVGEEIDFAWAEAWGGQWADAALGVTVNDSDAVFVAGYFTDIVQFSDTFPPEVHESVGGSDAYVMKFNQGGAFRWIEVWGDDDNDSAYSVALQDDESVCVTGYFRKTIEIGTSGVIDSEGFADVFLVKFRDIGTFTNFEWLRTWGWPKWAQGMDVAVAGSDYIYVSGRYNQVVDPGPAEQRVAFLLKVDSDGNDEWFSDWAGPMADDWAEGVSVICDDDGFPFVAGWYIGTIDFDSGPGFEFHTSNGQMDAFVCRFDANGPFPTQPVFEEMTPGFEYRNHIINVVIDGYVLQNVDEIWLEYTTNDVDRIYAWPPSISATPDQIRCTFDLHNATVGMYHLKGLAGAVIVDPLLDAFEVRNLAASNADWTFLVYVEDGASITDTVEDNINEMEDAGSLEGDLNIVVLWNRFSVQDQIMYIEYHDSQHWNWDTMVSPLVNDSGVVLPLFAKTQEEIMEDFIIWAMGDYPADHYAFFVSSVGGFPNILTDEPIWVLRDAVETVLAHPVCNVSELDIIGLEVVNMSYVETAYTLQDVTRSIIANEVDSPLINFWDFGGLRYTEPLVFLRDNATTATHDQICTVFVDEYVGWLDYPPGKNLSSCSTDDPEFGALVTALDAFAFELNAAWTTPEFRDEIEQAQLDCGTWGYDCSDVDDKDIGLFAQLIADNLVLPPALTGAAQSLRDAVDEAVIFHAHSPDMGLGTICPFEETGLQIWFPQNYCDHPDSIYWDIGWGSSEWDKFLRKSDSPSLDGCNSAQEVLMIQTIVDEVVSANSANWYHFNSPTGVDDGWVTINMAAGNADLYIYATDDPGNCPGELIGFSVNESPMDHIHVNNHTETDWYIMVLNDECIAPVTYDIDFDLTPN